MLTVAIKISVLFIVILCYILGVTAKGLRKRGTDLTGKEYSWTLLREASMQEGQLFCFVWMGLEKEWD